MSKQEPGQDKLTAMDFYLGVKFDKGNIEPLIFEHSDSAGDSTGGVPYVLKPTSGTRSTNPLSSNGSTDIKFDDS